MKKIVAFLAVAVLTVASLLSLVACGDTASTTSEVYKLTENGSEYELTVISDGTISIRVTTVHNYDTAALTAVGVTGNALTATEVYVFPGTYTEKTEDEKTTYTLSYTTGTVTTTLEGDAKDAYLTALDALLETLYTNNALARPTTAASEQIKNGVAVSTTAYPENKVVTLDKTAKTFAFVVD